MLVELRINCHSSCCSVLNCVHLAGSLIPVLDPLSPFACQDSASALALLENRANRCAISQRISLPMVMLSTRICWIYTDCGRAPPVAWAIKHFEIIESSTVHQI